MDCFLYDIGLRHERVKVNQLKKTYDFLMILGEKKLINSFNIA